MKAKELLSCRADEQVLAGGLAKDGRLEDYSGSLLTVEGRPSPGGLEVFETARGKQTPTGLAEAPVTPLNRER